MAAPLLPDDLTEDLSSHGSADGEPVARLHAVRPTAPWATDQELTSPHGGGTYVLCGVGSKTDRHSKARENSGQGETHDSNRPGCHSELRD
jgi:hypothetical protein